MIYTDLIVHAFVILVLFYAYIKLEQAYRAQTHPTAGDTKAEETKNVKDFDIPIPQIKQLQKEVDRANDFGDGAVQLFHKLDDRQQALKVNVENVMASIRDLQESLKSIDAQTQRFANISDLQETVKSIDAQTRQFANIRDLQESIKSIDDHTRRFANILLGPQSKGRLVRKSLSNNWINFRKNGSGVMRHILAVKRLSMPFACPMRA